MAISGRSIDALLGQTPWPSGRNSIQTSGSLLEGRGLRSVLWSRALTHYQYFNLPYRHHVHFGLKFRSNFPYLVFPLDTYFGLLLRCLRSGTFPGHSHRTDELHYCTVINMYAHAYSCFTVNSHRRILGVCRSHSFPC
jgi:hypothetical protein